MTARLLAGAGPEPIDLQRHRRLHGELSARIDPQLAEEIERVRLRGRGGGAFPLAAKLAAVRRARGTPCVVINGCEGDPLSAKDRVLIAHAPQLVIDGALCLAQLVGAPEIFLAVEGTAPSSARLHDALRQRPEPHRGHVALEIVDVPEGYVNGQETAVVQWLGRGDARPTSGPRVSRRGVRGRPTLVANAETAAHVGLLAHHGADWYAAVGVPEQPGTTLVTVSGPADGVGVREIAHGVALSTLLSRAGFAAADVDAVLIGGCAGTWIPGGRVAELTLDDRSLAVHGARLGVGAIAVLPVTACPVAELSRAVRWLADRSCGQCGPCVHGLAAIAEALAEIRDGMAPQSAFGQIERWCELVAGRGACTHPDGTAHFVRSALQTFAADLEDHRRHGRCELCDAPPVLGLGELAVGR